MKAPLALAAWLALTMSVPAAEPPQGAALLKTDLLGVFAHPDDETGMAATLARYARGEGRVVAHAYCTRGEGGGNMVGTQLGPALGLLREVELRECLRELGVRHVFFLDQRDFFYTESLAATLRKWDREAALGRLVRIIRSLRPEVIVTMNPAPNPGQHGHHQAAGILATEAFGAAADPARFPEHLAEEGLGVWQAKKLYYGGAAGEHVATLVTTEPLIGGRTPADIAATALSHHRSQAFGNFAGSPWLRRPQTFALVRSVVTPAAQEADLFAGLPAATDARPVSLFMGPPVDGARLEFVPRPAIAWFRGWAAEQDIARLAEGFLADVPVIAGEWSDVALEALGGGAPARGTLKLALPEGWEARVPRPEVRLAGDAPQRITVQVRPPAGLPADAEATATLTEGDTPLAMPAKARLHPVPFARVPRTSLTPSLDDAAGWERAALLNIGTNHLWQGRVADAADSSGDVRLLHDGRTLFIQVAVRDDVVVTNIAPDDIKGHWRSDSVELCLDPAAGAEDTTGCFKVGIFPSDSAGRVRAARDADAAQGPVEQTAPGFRVASARTADGYVIRAAVPLELVAGRGKSPHRLGFNALIYDGDKPDARPGENIGESRLAWAPRSGIQGRPEDWGRIELE
ncbi:MAG: PIG-L family deacetylase [Limisphaerales bacterium]